jgi:DNA-binding transcriptional MocR family regulator
LLDRARARGVIFVVGDAFFVDGTGNDYVRLCFSSPTRERIAEGIKRLGQAMRD